MIVTKSPGSKWYCPLELRLKYVLVRPPGFRITAAKFEKSGYVGEAGSFISILSPEASIHPEPSTRSSTGKALSPWLMSSKKTPSISGRWIDVHQSRYYPCITRRYLSPYLLIITHISHKIIYSFVSCMYEVNHPFFV